MKTDYMNPDLPPAGIDHNKAPLGAPDPTQDDGLFHLSGDEKRQLAEEIRAYARSRVSGPACPSCLFDTLFYAAMDHNKEAMDEAERTGSIDVPWATRIRANDFAGEVLRAGARGAELERRAKRRKWQDIANSGV